MKRAMLLALLIPAVSAPASASGQEVEATWEGDATHGYSSLRLLVLIPIAGPHSLVVVGGFNHYFERLPDPDGELWVGSPGGLMALGYRFATESAGITIFSGYERREFRADQPDTSFGFGQRGQTTQIEAWLGLADFAELSVTGIGSEIDHDRWARASMARRVTPREATPELSLGPEVTLQEDRFGRASAAGGILTLDAPGSGTSLELRVGSTWSRYADGSRDTRHYWGTGLTKVF